MSNKIRQEMNKIDIPKELSERSKMGVSQAKKEMKTNKKRLNMKGFGIVAAVILIIGTYTMFNVNFSPNQTGNNQNTSVTDDGSIKVPAIQLPEDTSYADMIGLIVYNEKIYTQTSTEIDGNNATAIIGEKLGTTKGNINEWSKQDAYSEELASTYLNAEVYSVKGYDKAFRIMIYEEREGDFYAEFFENLNDITINNGFDIFGKLNMIDNVSTAQWRRFSDWDYSIENYELIEDMEIVNNFIKELNRTKPLLYEEISDLVNHSRNDEAYRELTLNLHDGSIVRLTLLKDGYISYGYMGVYFKMEDDVFSTMWSLLK